MKSFKTFLDIQEALRPSQYRSMVKGWDKTRLENVFKKSPLEKDSKAFRLYFPLEDDIKRSKKVNPSPHVIDSLKKQGYEVDDYTAGIAKKGNRKIRIGRLLNKEPSVLQLFVNDPARAATKRKYMGVISRHPYDIAGMSTDRGWTSCQDLEDGGMCEYVPEDIKAGSIIAYMIHSDDKNIKKPVGRLLIKPYINSKKETAYAVAKVSYGTVTKEFKKQVDQFVKWLNKQQGVSGVFVIDPNVYGENDADESILVTDDKNVKKIYKNPESVLKIANPTEEMLMVAVGREPRLIRDFKKPSENVQIAAVESSGSAIQWIVNPSEKVQMAAVKESPNSIIWISNPSEKVQLIAVENTSEPIIREINNPSEKVQMAAVKKRGHNIKYIKDPTEKVQMAAVKADSGSIMSINNPSEKVQMAAVSAEDSAIALIKNPSDKIKIEAIKAHITAARWLKKPSESVQLAIVKQDPLAIKYISTPSIDTQIAAVTADTSSFRSIKKPNKKTQELYKKLTGS